MFKINVVNGEYFNVASSVSGVLGKAVHKALQVYFGGHPDISVTHASAAKDGLEYGLEYIKNYNEAFIEYSSTIPTKEKLIEKFTFCYFGFLKEGGYDEYAETLLIEKEMKHTVEVDGKLLPIPLKGVVDLVYRDSEGRIIIEDHKTTYNFTNPDKIDGKKLVQAVFYFFLVWAELGEKPYAIKYSEFKYTQNKDNSEQLKPWVMIYEDYPMAFELFYRLYSDVTDALNGKQVYVPNFDAMFDNDIAIVSYINYLDVEERKQEQFKKMKVDNVADFVQKKMQHAGKMKNFLEEVSKKFISGKSLNYKDMIIEDKIKMKLAEHGIAVDFDSKIQGGTVTLYCYEPSVGVKMSKLDTFVKDIEQVVEKSGVRILAPIPNSGLIGFEVPNEHRNFPVPEKNEGFKLAIGETITGEVRRYDIREAPHMLVAGASGSGKSVFLNSLIRQITTLERSKLVLLDPKQVELAEWEDNENVMLYESNSRKISKALIGLVKEMENRYTTMKQLKVKNIEKTDLDYIFVVIDEYADLAMTAEVADVVKRLAQKGRAAGIHLIIATQRASTQVIDGDIKVNFSVRAIFKMSKEVDSRVMLDESGAEKLLGKGDCLFLADNGIERLQAYE